MPTYAPNPGRRGALRRFLQIALVAIALTMATGTRTTHPVAGFSTEGAETRLKPSKKPVIEAAFPRESYRPVTIARLVIFSRQARNVSVQLFRAGTENREMKPRDEMYGTAVTAARPLGTVRSGPGDRHCDTPSSKRSCISPSSPAPGVGSATRRSSFDRAVSARTGSRSFCRLSPGRPTTSATMTATAGRTPGTRTGNVNRSAWAARRPARRAAELQVLRPAVPAVVDRERQGRRLSSAVGRRRHLTGSKLARSYDLLIFSGPSRVRHRPESTTQSPASAIAEET